MVNFGWTKPRTIWPIYIVLEYCPAPSSDFITSSVLTSHRYYCSFAAIPLQKIPIYLLTGQNPNALSTAAINPTFVGGMELLSSTSSECAQPQVRRRKLFIQFWICEEGGRGEEGSDAIGGTIC